MKKFIAIFAAVALVVAFTVPVMAAEWDFYGNFRMATWYQADDFDNNAVLDDDADIQWEGGGNSRIGANVKVNDQIGGGFEVGYDGSDMYARKIFGTYTFGGGSQLLIGKTYSPSALFYSNSVFGGDGDLLGIGEFYNSRNDMVQLKMGGFKIAFIENARNNDALGDPEINVLLPKIEASYKLKADAFFLDIIAGYQTFELEDAILGSEDVDSYIGILGGGVNLGAFFGKAQVHMGQNMGNYGSAGPYSTGPTMSPKTDADIDTATWTVTDNDNLGGLVVLGFKASDMITVEGGVGYDSYEVDADDAPTETLLQYYLNCTITVAPGFFIVPEVGYIEYDPDVDNAPEPTRTYFGAKWQINF